MRRTLTIPHHGNPTQKAVIERHANQDEADALAVHHERQRPSVRKHPTDYRWPVPDPLLGQVVTYTMADGGERQAKVLHVREARVVDLVVQVGLKASEKIQRLQVGAARRGTVGEAGTWHE